MGAGNIRISPDQMRGRAKEFDQEASNVENCISKMDSLLNTLQQEWEGQASQAYAQRYTSELKPSFVSAKEMIQEISAALTKTAEEMEQIDQSIASGFSG